MLEENDHDILAWIMGRKETPSSYEALIQKVKTYHDL